MTWGEQTDVPESADWYNSSYIIAWAPTCRRRAPGRPLLYRSALQGHQTVAVTPDYAEVAKLCDHWLNPKQGTDSAMALAMGHVMLKEFHLDREVGYFRDYVRRYTDMPMLVLLEAREGGHYAAGRCARRRSGGRAGPGKQPRVENRRYRQPQRRSGGAAGLHRLPLGREGKWNLEQREGKSQQEVELQLSLLGMHDDVAEVGFPYFGGADSEHFNSVALDEILLHKLPVKRLQLADGSEALVTSVRPAACQRRPRAGWATPTAPPTMTRSRPTARPGPSRSPACRVTTSFALPASSRKTPRRPMAVR